MYKSACCTRGNTVVKIPRDRPTTTSSQALLWGLFLKALEHKLFGAYIAVISYALLKVSYDVIFVLFRVLSMFSRYQIFFIDMHERAQ